MISKQLLLKSLLVICSQTPEKVEQYIKSLLETGLMTGTNEFDSEWFGGSEDITQLSNHSDYEPGVTLTLNKAIQSL